jgi:hypothetical protein
MCAICPVTHASLLALISAVVASFVFGFLWYGPLFGKTWAGLMGFKMEDCKDKKPPVSALLLTLLGAAFTVFAMAYIINNYKPDCNFGAAFLIWLGFYVPLLFGSVTWEQRPWKLFALNAVYYFLNLQLIATILTFVH